MPAGTGVWVVKTRAAAHGLDGLGEGEARRRRPPADALEAEEAGVALVGVEHLGVDAERVEGPHAADAEEDLLAQAVLGVAAVEPVGDRRGARRVVRLDVGVEQVERHPADVGPPHPGDAAARRPGRPDADAVARASAPCRSGSRSG